MTYFLLPMPMQLWAFSVRYASLIPMQHMLAAVGTGAHIQSLSNVAEE